MGFVVNTSSKFVGAGFGRNIGFVDFEVIPISLTDLEFFIKEGVVEDLSPNKYSITNTNTTVSSNSLNGHDTFDFGGTADLQLANNSDADITSDLTIHIIVKQDNSSNSYYVSKGNNETANEIQYMINYNGGASDKFVSRVNSGGTNYSAEIASADEQTWGILTLVYKPSDVLEIWRNGTFINSVASPASLTSRAHKLTIGAHSDGKQSPLTGEVAAVIIRSNTDNDIRNSDQNWMDNEFFTPRLYHCDNFTDKLYELDPDTMLDISSGGVSSPSSSPLSVGGTGGRLYSCDTVSDKIYEHDPDTMLDISSGGVSSPSTNPTGIGGLSGRLYTCDQDADKIYELDPDTMLDISGGGVLSPTANPRGIGGSGGRLYHCENNTDKIYELDPDTMLDISGGGVSAPSTNPNGIGGMGGRLYNCDANSNLIFELDPDTRLDISGGGVSSPSTLPRGMGGLIDYAA